ncbi:MAG: hypothetical protein WKF58_15925 [Ilumatobacteraceae bacterium]
MFGGECFDLLGEFLGLGSRPICRISELADHREQHLLLPGEVRFEVGAKLGVEPLHLGELGVSITVNGDDLVDQLR